MAPLEFDVTDRGGLVRFEPGAKAIIRDPLATLEVEVTGNDCEAKISIKEAYSQLSVR